MLKGKMPKVYSRMGKATESSFNILKPKNLHEQSAEQPSQYAKPRKHKLGDPYAANAKDRAMSMFFESTEERQRFVHETKQQPSTLQVKQPTPTNIQIKSKRKVSRTNSALPLRKDSP